MARIPCGYRSIPDVTTVKDLNDAEEGGVPRGAKAVLVQAQGGTVYWRDDGIDPEVGVGMLIQDGTSFFYDSDLLALKFIGGDGAEVHGAFYK